MTRFTRMWCRWPTDAISAGSSPSSARSAQRDIRETSFLAIFLPILAGTPWEKQPLLPLCCRSLDLFSPSASLALATRARSRWAYTGKEREGEMCEMHPRKDDRAGPLAIISLATTRQMSDYCETRRLVGRFSPFCCSRSYGNNNAVGREHNNCPRECMSVRN